MADTNLNVDIRATDRTKRAFSSVDRNLGKLKQNLFSLKTAIGGAVGVAAVAGLARLADNALDTADAIAKTADTIGVTTDALQELRFAAERSGVETSKLDRSLQQFTKRLGEARSGTGSLTTFLKKFDQELLNSVTSAESVDDALNQVLIAMAQTTDESDRAALAAAAFGRAGIELTNIVKDGADGLEEMRARARDLGLVLEEDLLRNAENARDRIDELKSVISTTFTRVIINNADELAVAFERITAGLVEFLKEWGVIGRTVEEQLERINQKIAESIEKHEAANALLDGYTGELEKQNELIDERNELISQQFGDIENAIDKANKKAEQARDIAKDTAAARQKEWESIAQIGDELGIIAAKEDPCKREIKCLTDKERAAKKAAETQKREIERIQRASKRAADEDMRRAKRLEEQNVRMWERAGRSLTNYLSRGELSWKSFGATMLNVVTDVIIESRRISRQGGGGGSIFGDLFGSVFGGGTPPISPGSGSGPTFADFGDNTAGFAQGGRFTVGGGGGPDSKMVAFRASPREQVSITRPGQGGGGGVSIVYNIDARGAQTGVAEQIRLALDEREPTTIAAAVAQSRAAMNEETARGGPMARTVGRI